MAEVRTDRDRETGRERGREFLLLEKSSIPLDTRNISLPVLEKERL